MYTFLQDLRFDLRMLVMNPAFSSVAVLTLALGIGANARRLTLIGASVGLALSVALTRFMYTLLYGVGATDPVTFAFVSLLLAAAPLLASYIPARRAAKVDPMVALRSE